MNIDFIYFPQNIFQTIDGKINNINNSKAKKKKLS